MFKFIGVCVCVRNCWRINSSFSLQSSIRTPNGFIGIFVYIRRHSFTKLYERSSNNPKKQTRISVQHSFTDRCRGSSILTNLCRWMLYVCRVFSAFVIGRPMLPHITTPCNDQQRDMKWSNELILEFIHVYEKHPIIWDPDHPEHKNRKSHIDTWNSIGNQMSVDIPVEVLKKKKECLMATYRALKRKKTDNKPTWHAFEAMDRFLAKVRKDNSLYNLENINCMEQDDSANFEFDDVENESSKVSYHHMVEEIAEEIDMDDNKLVERIVLPIIDNNNVIRKKFISNGIIDDELRGYIRQTSASLREIQQKLNDQECNRNNCRAASSVTTTTNAESSGESSSSVSLTSSPSAATAENECNLYGQLLVTRLKAMPAKSRKILMHKIDQLVFDAEINEIN